MTPDPRAGGGRAAKDLVRGALGTLGLEVRRMRPSGWDPGNLRKEGFDPRTLVDVGVGFGTEPLYEAFPSARLLMVEPLREFEEGMRSILQTREGAYVLSALGEAEGSMTINVQPDNLQSSSLNERSELTRGSTPVDRRTIPVTTLDRLMVERSLEPPFGLKIDTEGHEDAVIRGGTAFLRETQFVISEVSVARRFEGSYGFADFIGLMKERGFVLCDILEISRLQSSEIRFLDAVFRREGTGA